MCTNTHTTTYMHKHGNITANNYTTWHFCGQYISSSQMAAKCSAHQT